MVVANVKTNGEIMKSTITKLALTAGLTLSALTAQATTIDILALYTPGATSKYNGNPETRINHLINVTNQIYADSNLDLNLRVVHTAEVNYSDTNNAQRALQDMTYDRHKAFSNVDALRDQFGADMVILYRPYKSSHGSCGIAWVGGNRTNGDFSAYYQKDYAFSHVAMDTCGDYVTAHELGHNMGLRHSRLQDGVGGTYDHALGHGEYGNFVTVMAYPSAFGINSAKDKIYKFSSPNLQCKNAACGVNKSSNKGADAVHALSVSAPQIADYFATKVDGDSNNNNDGDNRNKPEQPTTTLSELKQDWINAKNQFKTSNNAFKTAFKTYQNAEKAVKKAEKTYTKNYKNYQKAAKNVDKTYQKLIQSVNTYNAQARRVSAKKRQQLYKKYVKANSNYNKAVRKYQNSINKVNASVAPINTARANVEPLKQAYEQAKSQRDQDKASMISAKKAYTDGKKNGLA